MSDHRKRLYVVQTTLVETYQYDPEKIRHDFEDLLDAWTGTFEEFVQEIFEEHDGSIFANRYFDNDANPQYGVEVFERWDDE